MLISWQNSFQLQQQPEWLIWWFYQQVNFFATQPITFRDFLQYNSNFLEWTWEDDWISYFLFVFDFRQRPKSTLATFFSTLFATTVLPDFQQKIWKYIDQKIDQAIRYNTIAQLTLPPKENDNYLEKDWLEHLKQDLSEMFADLDDLRNQLTEKTTDK